MQPIGLCEFDLETRVARRVAAMPLKFGNGYITGSGIRDSRGDIYFVRHGGAPGTYGLVKITFGGTKTNDVSRRSEP